MQVYYDIDSSYFTINLLGGLNVSQDVVDLQITEEAGKFLTGSITFYDPNFTYSQAFKAGVNFELTWGYKNRNINVFSDIITQNKKELLGFGVRIGQKCIITNSQWNASDKGVVLYTCSFYSSFFLRNVFKTKIHSGGTRRQLIQLLFAELQVSIPLIKFDSETTVINQNNIELQSDTSYKMLSKLADEWRCLMYISHTVTGQVQGLFINMKDIGGDLAGQFNQNCVGGLGTTKTLNYGVGNDATNPNVISYSAQNHVGDNGQGDNAQITLVGGKVVITRYVSQEQSVETLELDENKVKQFAETHSPEMDSIITSAVTAGTLDTTIYKGTKLKDFFTVVKSETAPQGTGFTINAEMIGDTAFTPPIEILPAKGFPPNMFEWTRIARFFLKKVTHRLNVNGYKMSVEVSDAVTAFDFQQEPK